MSKTNDSELIMRPLSQEAGISALSRQHNKIRKEISARYPDVRGLSKPQPLTVLALPAILAVHWGITYYVAQTNIVLVFLTALFVGQIVIHAAGTLVHETCHKLIFRARIPKLLFDLGLEFIVASYGRQLIYQHEHISSHHPMLGSYDHDYEHEDILAWRARYYLTTHKPRTQRLLTLFTLFLHLLPLGFLISDYLLPPLYRRFSGMPVKDKLRNIGATKPKSREMALFILVSITSNIVMFSLFGFTGWLYHIWCLSLFLGKWGVTNLGQSLSEHSGSDSLHPTTSVYWWGNLMLFNTGYHNEHHSFPNVPWTALPTLRRMAPEYFQAVAPKSYFGLWWDHIGNDFSPTRFNKHVHQEGYQREPKPRDTIKK